jgi:hypothetical protein
VRSRLPTLPSGHPEKILRIGPLRADFRADLCACSVARVLKGGDASPLCGAPLHGEDQERVAGWGIRIRTWTNRVSDVLSPRLLLPSFSFLEDAAWGNYQLNPYYLGIARS